MKTKKELIKMMFESDTDTTLTDSIYYQSTDFKDFISVMYRLDSKMNEKVYTISDFVTFVYNRNSSDDYGALDMD